MGLNSPPVKSASSKRQSTGLKTNFIEKILPTKDQLSTENNTMHEHIILVVMAKGIQCPFTGKKAAATALSL